MKKIFQNLFFFSVCECVCGLNIISSSQKTVEIFDVERERIFVFANVKSIEKVERVERCKVVKVKNRMLRRLYQSS